MAFVTQFSVFDIDSYVNIVWLNLPTILSTIPKDNLHRITGNMLGDGHIRAPKNSKNGIRNPDGQALFAFTQSIDHYDYIKHLYNDVYSPFIKTSNLVPYPNSDLAQHKGKPVERYTFATATSPLFTELHKIWYVWVEDATFGDKVGRWIKIVPSNLEDMFSEISLAYWLMDDGSWNKREKTIYLSTDSFSSEDLVILQKVLSKYGIDSGLVKKPSKNNPLGCSLRIRTASASRFVELVSPYILPSFTYKLGR